MSAIKRLQMEYNQILKDTNYYYSVEPDKKNFLKWNIMIFKNPKKFLRKKNFIIKFLFY